MDLTQAIQHRDMLRANGVKCQLRHAGGLWSVLIAYVDY